MASGQVLRIDPRSGQREVLADFGPGLDNCTFLGERLFVSHTAGSIHEVLGPGNLRPLSEKGLLWPMGLAVSADGSLLVVDGSYAYLRTPSGDVMMAGMLGAPGFPGAHRGAAAAGNGEWYVTTSFGEIRRWSPQRQENELLADGCDLLMGIAADANGRLVFADYGSGRVLALENGAIEVLASGLDTPSGVAFGSDGTAYATESGAGRVVKVCNGTVETVADGLKLPEGIAVQGDKLYVVDVGARELVRFDIDGTARETIVAGLPVGTPTTPRKYLGPVGDMSGPMLSFAGVAIGTQGEIFVGADGNGSVIALYPPRD
jgi:sugar lactone lactonase YvrE